METETYVVTLEVTVSDDDLAAEGAVGMDKKEYVIREVGWTDNSFSKMIIQSIERKSA